MIKIYVDGVNAVSGESAAEDDVANLRRQKKLTANQIKPSSSNTLCLQDYLVVPAQPWLDAFVDSNGAVHQFMARSSEVG